MDEKRKTRYVLLSIHPKYVRRIASGKKYYEFRKKFPLHADRFVFYSTSPEKKIVAVAEKSHVLIGDLEYIWEESKDVAGVSREEFEKYYDGCTRGVAVGLVGIKRLRVPISIERIGFGETSAVVYVFISGAVGDY